MKKFLLSALFLSLATGMFMLGVNTRELKAGDGKTVFETRCLACHSTKRIERVGHDLDGWKKTVERMMGKAAFGPGLSDAEIESLLNYLTGL